MLIECHAIVAAAAADEIDNGDVVTDESAIKKRRDGNWWVTGNMRINWGNWRGAL